MKLPWLKYYTRGNGDTDIMLSIRPKPKFFLLNGRDEKGENLVKKSEKKSHIF